MPPARQGDRDDRGGGDPLAETHGHDDRDHHRIDEQDRRGDAGVHEVVTLEKRRRRDGEEHAHSRKRQDVAPPQGERLPPEQHQRTQHHHSQHIAVEQHGIHSQARAVKRRRKERIQSVAGRGYGSQHITAGTFRDHLEGDLRSGRGPFGRLEIGLLAEAEHPRDEVGREAAHRNVVLPAPRR